MKKIINKINIILFLIILPLNIYAGSILSEEDKREFGYAQSLNNLNKYEESLKILENLHIAYPEQEDIAFELAKALGLKGEMNRAIDMLDSLSNNDALNVAELRVAIYEANNLFEKAVFTYKKLYEKYPDNSKYILKIARISSWLKDYQTSITFYKDYIKTNNNSVYLIELANVYFWNKQPNQAFNLYADISLEDFSDNKELENYAYCAMSVKNFKRASELFLTLYQREGKDKWLEFLASCSEWNGDYEASEKYYEILLEKKPTASLKEKLANIYYQKNELEKAKKLYTEVGYKNLNEKNSLSNMEDICLKKQDFASLKDILHELLDKSPDNQLIIHKLAKAYMYLQEYRKSIEFYNKLLELAPEDKEYLKEIANVYYYNHNYSAAVKFYKKIESDVLKDHELLKNYAFSLLNSGNTDEAILYFENLQKSFPEDLNLSIILVDLFLKQGEKVKANDLLTKLVEKKPDDEELKLKLAELLAAEKVFSESISLLNDILENSPENREALLRKARYLSWNKDYDESILIYNQMINLDEEWLTPQREKARVLGWQTSYQDAIKAYKDAVNNFPDSLELGFEKNAKYYYYNNFYRSSAKYYEKWLDLEADDLEALFDLAQISSRLFDWERASKYYKECINIFPMHNRAKQALTKGDIMFSDFKLETFFEYLRAESSNRQVDKNIKTGRLALISPFIDNLQGGVSFSSISYLFKSDKDVYRNDFNFLVNYIISGWLSFEGQLKHSDFTDGYDSKSLYDILLEFYPIDYISLKGIVKKDLFIENEETLKDLIIEKNYVIRTEFHSVRNILVGIDLNKTKYSDNNECNGYKYDFNVVLHNAPFWLKAAYKYMAKDYDFESLLYFSPKDFYAHYIEVEYRHFFNTEQLYWGANDMWLLLRYEYNKDKGGAEGHNFGLEYFYDINDRVNISIGLSRLDYTQRSIYKEKKLNIKGSFYF